ncbi:hypothetical protein [Eikenella corrodens]|jgi:hypothetical protein|uniref:CopG family transcriptional regulator n=1 Tax=Eikenella corrodens TaxID=539 RepID=A0A1A9RMF4_EIKCO|nr:hypothetical protein [Eikenella corrodens]OAM20760.1 hypothetical protein A7P90_03550 [Eikenella corrodens]OAM37814.1 hypothetical protein A7P99_05395 [Eikenella sp. NML120348]OAM44434.1 hypothetical protein A7Q03_08710 [Eikenella sp. NML99-0057]DAS78037.1 MAG TPA: Transcriptional repressor arc(10) helix, beta-ribbon, beta-sheet, structural [Caudoviricetes sp.]
MKREKCTEEVKLHIPQAMKDDLKTLAALNGFTSLSAYIRYVLDGHAYGHVSSIKDLLTETVRD